MARVRRAAGLALLLLAVSGCWSQGSPVAASQPAQPDALNNRVGALFVGDLAGPRMCTASIISSPHHNLLVTAAHCVESVEHGKADGLVFAPGYRDGLAPYQTWPVSSVTVDPHWTSTEDPEYDVAFLTVDQVNGRQIEDVLGGNPLATGQGFGVTVQVTGYPGERDRPITCRTRTLQHSPTQQRFDCAGYTDGTSGSPWVTAGGAVIGVIGGYQQGGDTDATSYSITFDDRVAALYQQATSA
jgi:V8-like Glu-specific endopeptidase